MDSSLCPSPPCHHWLRTQPDRQVDDTDKAVDSGDQRRLPEPPEEWWDGQW